MADSAEDYRRQADEVFVQLLTAEQIKLLHYIAMLLGDPHSASNVLQETNIVLWRKACEFKAGSNFSAWARQVAFWQVQACVRDRRRDRHVFSEELVSQLAIRANADVNSEPDETESLLALRHCLHELNRSNRELLQQRYEDANSIASVATKFGMSLSAVKVRLLRIRRALLRCIEKQLAAGDLRNA
jgi:RNA polymerase sigma-70 factor (ECF subfamily)